MAASVAVDIFPEVCHRKLPAHDCCRPAEDDCREGNGQSVTVIEWQSDITAVTTLHPCTQSPGHTRSDHAAVGEECRLAWAAGTAGEDDKGRIFQCCYMYLISRLIALLILDDLLDRMILQFSDGITKHGLD